MDDAQYVEPVDPEEDWFEEEEIGDPEEKEFGALDAAEDDGEFDANLAEQLDDDYLSRLAQRVCEWVKADTETRADWQAREARGIRLLGVTEKVEGGADFEGAAKVVHPMLALAMVQFQSRAIKELWPAGGPVKTVVLGEKTEERADQSERVEGYLNYLYSERMPGAFAETDRLLQRLPGAGSAFKRVYRCPIEQEVVSMYTEPSRVYVPYDATSLQTAGRFTYEFPETANDTRRKQNAGFYLDDERVNLQDPTGREHDLNATERAVDDADGKAPAYAAADEDGEDRPYTRYECACFLDLPGHEDEDEEGMTTGIGLPYLVTVDKEAQKVLRIARNWRDGDPLKKRRVHLIHYYFTPGFGFYGFGLYHLIGGLASAATGAIRSLLDAAYLHNIKGGFYSKDAAMRTGDIKMRMGEWNELPLSPEEMDRAFHEFVYSAPSDTLVKLLDLIQSLGGQLGSTSDNLLGDANNNAPVGTTLALIEQGLEPISAIHKRLHEAQQQEFRLVAELVSESMDASYPYAVEGADREVMAADFDERVDVLPKSDPNTVTNTQRIARAQSVVQLADGASDLYDRRRAHRDMLEVMRVPNIDELLPEPGETPRMDPVSEGAAMMRAEPVQVFEDQDHAAHLQVHRAGMGALPEDLLKEIGAAAKSHMHEHMALLYRGQVMAGIGVAAPPGPDAPPEVQAAFARLAAEVPLHPLPSVETTPDAGGSGEDASLDRKTEAEIARKDTAAEAEIARKDRSHAAEMERQVADDITATRMEKARVIAAMEQAANTAPRGAVAGGIDAFA